MWPVCTSAVPAIAYEVRVHMPEPSATEAVKNLVRVAVCTDLHDIASGATSLRKQLSRNHLNRERLCFPEQLFVVFLSGGYCYQTTTGDEIRAGLHRSRIHC
jgi:hypothetical protein